MEEIYGDPEAFEKLYIGDKDSCIPEEFIGEDLLLDIKEKFYSIFHPIREQLEKEKIAKKPIYIFVDPSYEDVTAAVITYGCDELLCVYYEKPWHLNWDSTVEMEKELNEIYEEIKRKLTEGK